jgi:hypothetical protein
MVVEVEVWANPGVPARMSDIRWAEDLFYFGAFAYRVMSAERH